MFVAVAGAVVAVAVMAIWVGRALAVCPVGYKLKLVTSKNRKTAITARLLCQVWVVYQGRVRAGTGGRRDVCG